VAGAFAFDLLRSAQTPGSDAPWTGAAAAALDELPGAAYSLLATGRWPGFERALDALRWRDRCRAAGLPDAAAVGVVRVLADAPGEQMEFGELLARWNEAYPQWGFGDWQLWGVLELSGTVAAADGELLGARPNSSRVLRVTGEGHAAMLAADTLRGAD
jgi:hypothetical protein